MNKKIFHMHMIFSLLLLLLSKPLCAMQKSDLHARQCEVKKESSDAHDYNLAGPGSTDFQKQSHAKFLEKYKDRPVEGLIEAMCVCYQPLIAQEVENIARRHPKAMNTPLVLKPKKDMRACASIKTNSEDLNHRGYPRKYARYKGYTPFTYAIENKDPQFVEIFINCGADLNKPDGNDRTPLMCAYRKGVFALLLSAGADIHQKNSKRETPLMHAIYHFGLRDENTAFDAITTLLDAGADPSNGRLSLKYAHEHVILTDLLKKYYENLSREPHSK